MRQVPMRRVRAAALLALCTACASAPPGMGAATPPAGITGDIVRLEEARPSILEFRYVKADDVWAALPAAFRALEIPGGIMDPAARIYGNPQIRESSVAGQPTRNLFRCTNEGAGVASQSMYRIEFGIAAQPRAVEEGGSELILRIHAGGRLVDPARSGTIHCVSNGRIERRLKQQIDLEIARRMTGSQSPGEAAAR